jgi:hypothetical protein
MFLNFPSVTFPESVAKSATGLRVQVRLTCRYWNEFSDMVILMAHTIRVIGKDATVRFAATELKRYLRQATNIV